MKQREIFPVQKPGKVREGCQKALFLRKTMNRAEYCILRSAIKTHGWLREVAYKFALSQTAVAVAASNLFQNGNIIARVFHHKNDPAGTANIILTPDEIQANLNGKLRASYELTPQGGARWEAVAQADWNRYFEWYSDDYKSIECELWNCELVAIDRHLIEWLLSIDCYLPSHSIHIPSTEVWDIIEPWQATYWKTLPRAYRVRYQARERVPHIGPDTPLDIFETYQQAQKWYSEISEWYIDPEFEEEPLNITDYPLANNYTAANETAIQQAEYFIVRRVWESFGDCNQNLQDVALDFNLSQADILIAAHNLFQKGDILAEVYRDGTKFSDVAMTLEEIQATLDGKLQPYYYLSAEGGSRWEAVFSPNWNRYYKYVCRDYRSGKIPEYECEILSADRQLIKKLLSVSTYIWSEVPIPGTEVWDVLEPWQATYWKTLPRAYRVRYKARQNNRGTNTSPKEEAAMRQAYEWFSEIQKWYAEPAELD
ncbi:hypothetical protein [Kamptonema formosum]|uniref:hypothetical protein n=1 Tax=Kamptonema formosum TaxID=331992 RepID=UPI00034B227F|nr:hypothetical protein [Oscillatoria sp. PCC 10802]